MAGEYEPASAGPREHARRRPPEVMYVYQVELIRTRCFGKSLHGDLKALSLQPVGQGRLGRNAMSGPVFFGAYRKSRP